MWSTVSKSVLLLSLFGGGILSFVLFEVWSFANELQLFDSRHLGTEMAAVGVGLASGLIVGVYLDWRFKSESNLQVHWLCLFIGLGLFIVARGVLGPLP